MNAKIDPAIGERIKGAREARELNQEQLAELVGGYGTKISNWENGGRLPDADAFVALARALGVSVDYLLTGDEVPGAAEVVRELEEMLERIRRLLRGGVDAEGRPRKAKPLSKLTGEKAPTAARKSDGGQ